MGIPILWNQLLHCWVNGSWSFSAVKWTKKNAGTGDTEEIYRVSQEEWTKLRESVPYVELYRYNPKHLYPKLKVTEIMAREVWNFDSCYTLIDYQIHIETGRDMWFL